MMLAKLDKDYFHGEKKFRAGQTLRVSDSLCLTLMREGWVRDVRPAPEAETRSARPSIVTNAPGAPGAMIYVLLLKTYVDETGTTYPPGRKIACTAETARLLVRNGVAAYARPDGAPKPFAPAPRNGQRVKETRAFSGPGGELMESK
jgi:hypothetical protein